MFALSRKCATTANQPAPSESAAQDKGVQDETSPNLEEGPAVDNAQKAQGSRFVFKTSIGGGRRGVAFTLWAGVSTALCLAAYIVISNAWPSARHGWALGLIFLPTAIAGGGMIDGTVAFGYGKVGNPRIELVGLVVITVGCFVLIEYTPMGFGTSLLCVLFPLQGVSNFHHVKDGKNIFGVEEMEPRMAYQQKAGAMIWIVVASAFSIIFWFPAMCEYNDILAGVLLSLQAALSQYVVHAFAHHLETSNKFESLTPEHRGGIAMSICYYGFLIDISVEFVVVLYEGIIQPDQYAPWIVNLALTFVLNCLSRSGALEKLPCKYLKREPPNATDCAFWIMEFFPTYSRFAFPFGLMCGRLLGGCAGPWYFNDNVAAMMIAYFVADAFEDALVWVLKHSYFRDDTHEHRDYYSGLDTDDIKKAFYVADDGVLTRNFKLKYTTWLGIFQQMSGVVTISSCFLCSLISLDYLFGLSADPFAPSRSFWWG